MVISLPCADSPRTESPRPDPSDPDADADADGDEVLSPEAELQP